MLEEHFYSGVGSRRTSADRMGRLTRIATALDARNYILRSGAADGPDTAFERGAAVSRRRIYVPNETFGNRPKGQVIVPKNVNLMLWLKACLIAERFHPQGSRMPQDVRELMGRNVYQVLGDNLRTPSDFLICEAPLPQIDDQGRVVDVDGGTGLAVRLATAYGVPVYHLSQPSHAEVLEEFIADSSLLRPAPPPPVVAPPSIVFRP